MSINENEAFKKDFNQKLEAIKQKLNKQEVLSRQDIALLLMASVLEEEAKA